MVSIKILYSEYLVVFKQRFGVLFFIKFTSFWSVNGLVRTHVLNLSRYATLSPNKTLRQYFCAVNIEHIRFLAAPPHADMQYDRWDSKRV